MFQDKIKEPITALWVDTADPRSSIVTWNIITTGEHLHTFTIDLDSTDAFAYLDESVIKLHTVAKTGRLADIQEKDYEYLTEKPPVIYSHKLDIELNKYLDTIGDWAVVGNVSILFKSIDTRNEIESSYTLEDLLWKLCSLYGRLELEKEFDDTGDGYDHIQQTYNLTTAGTVVDKLSDTGWLPDSQHEENIYGLHQLHISFDLTRDLSGMAPHPIIINGITYSIDNFYILAYIVNSQQHYLHEFWAYHDYRALTSFYWIINSTPLNQINLVDIRPGI